MNDNNIFNSAFMNPVVLTQIIDPDPIIDAGSGGFIVKSVRPRTSASSIVLPDGSTVYADQFGNLTE